MNEDRINNKMDEYKINENKMNEYKINEYKDKRKAKSYRCDSWNIIHRERSKTYPDEEGEKFQRWLFRFHNDIQQQGMNKKASSSATTKQ